jgi:hypothetical protein
LQLDYLWHNFEMIHLRGNGGEMPFYIGLGGDLVTGDSALFAGRLPIGLSYIFNKRDFPVDLFLQVVPTLWFYQDRTSFYLYTEGGIHIYP